MITLRAKFDGTVLIPIDPLNLVTGQVVELQVVSKVPSGSPAEILSAMQSTPHIPAEDVDAMERVIREAHEP